MRRVIPTVSSRTRVTRSNVPAILCAKRRILCAKRRLAPLASGIALCLTTLLAGQPALGQSCSISIPGVPDFDQKRATTATVSGLPNDDRVRLAERWGDVLRADLGD